jgi:hypothetical protein
VAGTDAVHAAINASYQDEALAHIRRHVEGGSSGVFICRSDCPFLDAREASRPAL